MTSLPKRYQALSLSLLGAAVAASAVVGCSSTPDEETTASKGGASGTGGAAAGGASGSAAGGTAGASGTSGASGTTGTGGSDATGGSATGGTATGGTPTGGSGGSGPAGMGGGPMLPPLDCGGKGVAIENHGPTTNRVNYAIIGDGYSAAELDTTYLEHIQTYITKRFSDPIGQPYLRYRNFVNICAIKVESTPICATSTFGCCGDDQSRLARCNNADVNAAFTANLPASFEVDWRSLVLNGDSWWNTGASLMLWSGGNRDAAGAALHEGGHGFHQLADEYGDCSSGQVNVTDNNTTSGGKWDAWIGYVQTPGTGEQGFFACTGNAHWRPADNSMMDSLFGNDPDTSYNTPTREKMIMDIWRIIQTPWDSLDPPAGAVSNPAQLTVNVIDPAVISVDWSVDGAMVAPNGGPTLPGAMIPAGSHMVTARAYDNAGMDLVRQGAMGMNFNRQYWGPPTQANGMRGSEKTATWTVTK